MRQRYFLTTAISFAALAAPASAWHFECRFIERVGNVDSPLANDTLILSDTLPHRVRVQFGVFDDANGPAPAAGFIGWNVGVITVNAPSDASDETRTPGRLRPFNFAPNGNGIPPPPGGDPFEMLTALDVTTGVEQIPWVCNPDGTIPPPPLPPLRGFNTFVSIYEITTDPRDGEVNAYSISFAGNLFAAIYWTTGNHFPPDCGDPADPSDDIPSVCVYAPFPTASAAVLANTADRRARSD